MAKLTASVGKRTKIKLDEEGRKIGGGTLVTQAMQDAADAIEAENLIIKEDNTRQVEKAIIKAIATALEEMGLAAERFAKLKCPVDTGRLRNSITHAIEMHLLSGEAYVGTNVEYAQYVELGTSRRAARPFLRPAAEDHSDFYRKIMEKHLKNA